MAWHDGDRPVAAARASIEKRLAVNGTASQSRCGAAQVALGKVRQARRGQAGPDLAGARSGPVRQDTARPGGARPVKVSEGRFQPKGSAFLCERLPVTAKVGAGAPQARFAALLSAPCSPKVGGVTLCARQSVSRRAHGAQAPASRGKSSAPDEEAHGHAEAKKAMAWALLFSEAAKLKRKSDVPRGDNSFSKQSLSKAPHRTRLFGADVRR
jgi:hypothetical protein